MDIDRAADRAGARSQRVTLRCRSQARTWRRSPIGRSRPNLFDDIVKQKFPPGPGPQASSDAAPFAQQEELNNVLGKLTWDAVPWSQPIPLVAGG